MPTQERTNFPSTSANRAIDSTRCTHRTPSGRRCKLPVEGPGQLLCYTHGIELKKSDVLNLKNALLTGCQGFQTAQSINYSLTNLYKLLANNYISPRRASVLAYINSLLLRTLPAIDADLAAGIKDPTVAEEFVSDSAPDKASATSEAQAAPPATGAPPAKENVTSTPENTDASAWPNSIPQPDPTKKPS